MDIVIVYSARNSVLGSIYCTLTDNVKPCKPNESMVFLDGFWSIVVHTIGLYVLVWIAFLIAFFHAQEETRSWLEFGCFVETLISWVNTNTKDETVIITPLSLWLQYVSVAMDFLSHLVSSPREPQCGHGTRVLRPHLLGQISEWLLFFHVPSSFCLEESRTSISTCFWSMLWILELISRF